MKILVLGGGISGQMVQWAIPEADILEIGEKPADEFHLTRHYGPNYLWEPIIDGCVPFDVITHIDGRPATLQSVAAYKRKIGKEFDLNDATAVMKQFPIRMTGYDFQEIPEPRILYKHRVIEVDLEAQILHLDHGRSPMTYDYLISTIPLYSLLSLCRMWERQPRLQYKPIFIRVDPRPPDAPYPKDTVYVNYLTKPELPYRMTDRGKHRHWESLEAIPGPQNKKIIPGKILPNPHIEFYHQELNHFHIYCFGRFATWNGDELSHQTWANIINWRSRVL